MISRGAGVLRRLPTNISLSSGIVLVAVFVFAPLLGWTLASALTVDRWLIWVILVGISGVAFVPVLVRWPVLSTFGPYALVAVSLDAFPLLPGGASLSKPVGVLAGAVLLAAGLIERRLGRPPRAALWWGLLMFWAALTAVWAIDDDLVFGRLSTALSLFFLYVVAVSFKPSRQEVYGVCALIVLGGVFSAVLAYTFGLNELASGTAARGRLMLGDIDTNPNTLGRLLVLPLTLATAGFIGCRGMLQKSLALGCLAFIAVGVFISMSRGAVVGAIAMLAVLLYRMRARWQVVAAALVLLAVSTAAPAKFYERMTAVVSGEDDTGSGRTEIWKTGVYALADFGLTGAGLNNFKAVYKRYVATDRGTAAHNTYLMIWVELGTPGLLAMLAAIASGFLALRGVRRGAHGSILLPASEAACVAMLVTAVFGDQMWLKTFWLPWILLVWSVEIDGQSTEM